MLKKELPQFLNYIEFEKKLSQNTLDAYKRDCDQFIKAHKKRGKEGFEEYLRSLSKKYKPTTVERKKIAINEMIKFFSEESFMENVEKNKKSTKLPSFIKEEEIIEEESELIKDVVIEILLKTGIRVSELVNIRINDFEKTGQVYKIKIFGKGSKERIVFLDEKTKNKVDKYVEKNREERLKKTSRKSDYLLLNKRGLPLSRRSAWEIVVTEAEKTNPGKKVSPHTLRHSFATKMLREGADIKTVQELLGHENVVTTQIYTHLVDKEKEQKYRQKHPRD